jgi:hypothetical protein
MRCWSRTARLSPLASGTAKMASPSRSSCRPSSRPASAHVVAENVACGKACVGAQPVVTTYSVWPRIWTVFVVGADHTRRETLLPRDDLAVSRDLCGPASHALDGTGRQGAGSPARRPYRSMLSGLPAPVLASGRMIESVGSGP